MATLTKPGSLLFYLYTLNPIIHGVSGAASALEQRLDPDADVAKRRPLPDASRDRPAGLIRVLTADNVELAAGEEVPDDAGDVGRAHAKRHHLLVAHGITGGLGEADILQAVER